MEKINPFRSKNYNLILFRFFILLILRFVCHFRFAFLFRKMFNELRLKVKRMENRICYCVVKCTRKIKSCFTNAKFQFYSKSEQLFCLFSSNIYVQGN